LHQQLKVKLKIKRVTNAYQP